MERQSAMQQGGGANAGSASGHEWVYPGGWQPEKVAVDGALLIMKLLEDTAPVSEQPPEDVDRLSRVIRSLEAEIGGGNGQPPPPSAVSADGGGGTAEHAPAGDDDVHNGGLEDYLLLPDLDSIPGPSVAAGAPLEYWTEISPAVGHHMGGWYLDGDGVMVGYEFREQCYYGYGYSESPHVDQVYIPLWE